MFRPRAAFLLLAATLLLPLAAVRAQEAPPAGSDNLPQLNEAPPPPIIEEGFPEGAEDSFEPEVTIVHRDNEVVEEYRVRGQLYMVKVTPLHGVPYYLVDEDGSGRMVRRDGVTPRLAVPMWVIKTW